MRAYAIPIGLDGKLRVKMKAQIRMMSNIF